MKKRMGTSSTGRPSKLRDSDVIYAVKEIGGRPSEKKCATHLKIDRKTFRNWRKAKGFPNHDALLDALEIEIS
jgi:hypothetical protein